MKTLNLSARASVPLTDLVESLQQDRFPGYRQLLTEVNHHLQVLVKSRLGQADNLLPLYQVFSSFREAFLQHLNTEEELLFPYALRLGSMSESAKREAFRYEYMLLGPLRLFRAEHQALLALNQKMEGTWHQISSRLPESKELDQLAHQLGQVGTLLTDHVSVDEKFLFPALVRRQSPIEDNQEKTKQTLARRISVPTTA